MWFGTMGRLVGVALTLLVSFGCNAANFSDAELLQELSDSTPELEIEEPQYTFVRNSARIVRISAQSIQIFGSDTSQRFTDVAFIESDRDNNVLNSGSAETVRYFTDSGNFELVGNVVFNSVEQRATIAAEYILWDNEKQKLSGKPNEMVVLTRPSGTKIEGKNLNADLSDRIIELESASGVIFPADTNDTTSIGALIAEPQ